jgi:hypothetical protein
VQTGDCQVCRSPNSAIPLDSALILAYLNELPYLRAWLPQGYYNCQALALLSVPLAKKSAERAREFVFCQTRAMIPLASIFLEFNLPDPTTWFYFSILLGMAMFFKFNRLFSVRNLDVLALFLLVPGVLLLKEATQPRPAAQGSSPDVSNFLVSREPSASYLVQELSSPVLTTNSTTSSEPASRSLWYGYLWLLCGSACFMVRCLLDLTLVGRPALSPNLNLPGLAWLGAALFICLVTVAVHRPAASPGAVGKQSAALVEIQKRAEDRIKAEIPGGDQRPFQTAFWVACITAVAGHLAIVVGLTFIGWRVFQDAHAGVAMATFYLLLPYTAYHVDQVHHVLPSALLVWAVAAYRKPTVSGLLLGVATCAGYFPALLFPAWLSFYWRRGAGRFSLAFLLAAGVGLTILAGILWNQGGLADSIRSALSLSDWQPWKQPSSKIQGFWTGLQWAWAYRIPVSIAYLAFVLTTSFWPWPKNLAHLIALSAAAIIGIQFWFADQGGIYVLWYLPLLLLLVFRPNLSDREAQPIVFDTDWLTRGRLAAVRFAVRMLRLPQSAARV